MKKLFRIYRGTPGKQYFEEFELDLAPSDNVITALMEIQMNPVNKQGEKVTPVAWEQGCLEEVCGSCSMLVNGKPRQSCTALISHYEGVITLAPLTKFPLVRDLIVDRTSMFDSLKKVHAWIEVDQAIDRGPGPKISPEKQEVIYSLSTCMTCGCCLEACPQVNDKSAFIGPAAISQVRQFNLHPTGQADKKKRLITVMGKGGIGDCGNAQNCVRVCPKNIPLTDSISAISRDTTIQAFKNIFSLPERE